MKRTGNLYPLTYDFDNIHHAYLKARRNKRYRQDILAFGALLEENLINIQNHLIWKSYVCGEYRQFTVYEPKERLIMALPFMDRVIQHALCNVIEPIYENGFYYHSYACRKSKGSHKASQQLSEWLHGLNLYHGENVYCLKADVSQYFQSIDHEILKGIAHRKIKCPDTLWLIDRIIDHNGQNFKGVGIPVGNLTSQLFANMYLNELDKHLKESLGVRYYMRYMDDFVILSPCKEYLKSVLTFIEIFLRDRLKLRLNPNTSIFKVKNGVDFVGYRHWHTHKKMRKANLKRIRKKIKKFIELYADGRVGFQTVNRSVQSWIGHIRHADTYNIQRKILASVVLQRNTKD